MSIAAAEGPRAKARLNGTAATPGWSVAGHCLYRKQTHELRLLDAPSKSDRSAREGTAEFVLVERGPLLLLCYRFGESAPWTAADYCWANEGVEVPPLGGPNERRALLSVIAPSGGYAGRVRNFTLSLDFTRALHSAIRERASTPWNPSAQAGAIRALIARWPSLSALAASAGVRTIGNP